MYEPSQLQTIMEDSSPTSPLSPIQLYIPNLAYPSSIMDRLNQYLKLSSALKEHEEPILPLASPITPTHFKIAPAVTPPHSPHSPHTPPTPQTPATPRSKRHHRRSFFLPATGSGQDSPPSDADATQPYERKTWYVPDSSNPAHINAPPTPSTPKRATWYMPRPSAESGTEETFPSASSKQRKSLHISPAIPPPTIEEALHNARSWDPFENVIFPGQNEYEEYKGLGLDEAHIRAFDQEFSFAMLAEEVQTAANFTISVAAAAGRMDVSMSSLAADTTSYVQRMLRAWNDKSGTPKVLYDALIAQALDPILDTLKPRDFDAWFKDVALMTVNALALNRALLRSAETAAGRLNQITFFGNRAVNVGDAFKSAEVSVLSPRNKRESWWVA